MVKYYANSSSIVNQVVKRYHNRKFFYVNVIGWENGDFKHHRGHCTFPTIEMCNIYLQDYDEVSEQCYTDALKDYFAIDKKMREEFIIKHKL